MTRNARLWIEVWLVQIEAVANGEGQSVNGCTAQLFDNVPAVALYMEVAK
jgi:hypothetical protein